MQKLIFRNAKGTEINLTELPFGVTNWEGFSNTSLNVQTQQVPFHDGSVYLDSLLSERELSVTVAVCDNNDLEERYRLKRVLISALNPKLGEGILIYHNDFLSRQITVIPQLPIFENKNSNDSGTLKASCVFTACIPYWEDLAETEVDLLSFDETEITNNGDLPCPITLEAKTFNIDNFSVKINDEKISLNGIKDADGILISTKEGKKAVISEELIFNLKSASPYFFSAICFGKGKWVIVGDSGTIITSTDGKDWKYEFSNTTVNLRSCCYSEEKKLFVVVGGNGAILTSPDAEEWTVCTPIVSTILWDVKFLKDIFIAVGDDGVILTSTDAITWTLQTRVTTSSLFSVAYGNGTFIAVGAEGESVISTNATSWLLVTTTVTDFFNKIIFSGEKGLFYAVGGNESVYSTADGQIFQLLHSTEDGFILKDCVYISQLSLFIAIGYSTQLIATEDFINFREYTLPVNRNSGLIYNATEGNLYILGEKEVMEVPAEEMNVFKTEEDLNVEYIINKSNSLRALAEDDSLLMGVGSNGDVYDSTDGEGWNKTETSYPTFHDITSTAVGFYAVCGDVNSGSILRIQKIYGSIVINSRAQGDKSFNAITPSTENYHYAVGNGGVAYRLSTSVVLQSTPTTEDLLSVCFAPTPQLVVAVGAGGVVIKKTYKSSGGWDSATSPTTSPLVSICWSEEKKLFVTITQTKIYVSADADNWVETDYNSGNYLLESVAYNDNLHLFMAVGTGGLIVTSPEGKKWTEQHKQSSPYSNFLQKSYHINLTNKNLIIGSDDYEIDKKEGVNIIDKITPDSNINLSLDVGSNDVLIYNTEIDVSAKLKFRQRYVGV